MWQSNFKGGKVISMLSGISNIFSKSSVEICLAKGLSINHIHELFSIEVQSLGLAF